MRCQRYACTGSIESVVQTNKRRVSLHRRSSKRANSVDLLASLAFSKIPVSSSLARPLISLAPLHHGLGAQTPYINSVNERKGHRLRRNEATNGGVTFG